MTRHNILQNEQAAEQYFQAVWLLKDPEKSPWPGQEGMALYDFFVFWHHRAMMYATPAGHPDRNAAHSGPVFLPWHRYLLLRLEYFMQEALEDPDFRMPYWDWAHDAESLDDPRQSLIWTEDYLGQFMDEKWEIRFDQNSFGDNPVPRAEPRPMRRFMGEWERNGMPVEIKMGHTTALQEMLDGEPVYDEADWDESTLKFRNLLEGWRGRHRFHNNVHLFVGGRQGTTLGDMVLSTSPNDPTFFLHHCFVDRVWAIWQNQYPDSPYLPGPDGPEELLFHRLEDRMYTFFRETITPKDMLEYREHYEYDSLDLNPLYV